MVHLLFQQDIKAVGQLDNNFNLTVTQNGISQYTVNSLGPKYVPHQLSPGVTSKACKLASWTVVLAILHGDVLIWALFIVRHHLEYVCQVWESSEGPTDT